MTESPQHLDEAGVGIVGVGLIGGSIAAALKQKTFPGKIIGFGRNEQRLQAACEAGLIDDFSTQPDPLVKEISLLVVCTPVDRIVADVRHFASHCEGQTLITDAGSVKGTICQELQDLDAGTFIGSHPLAGSEKSGFEAARPDLFENRLCFLTPHEHSPPAEIQRLERFWAVLGMRHHVLNPTEHDRLMSVTSHAPHLIAAATSLLLEAEFRPFTGTGFQDTTRIASGDPGLWKAIVMQNREQLSATLRKFGDIMQQISQAVVEGDDKKLEQLLELAKTHRDSLVS